MQLIVALVESKDLAVLGDCHRGGDLLPLTLDQLDSHLIGFERAGIPAVALLKKSF